MPGKVVGKILNIGYPGTVSRNVDSIIHNRVIKTSDTAGPAFGDPVVLNTDDTYSAFGSTGTMVKFVGVAVRIVKQATDYFTSAGDYKPGEPADVIERGTVTVRCNVGTPTAGGNVYIRITANGAFPAGVVGQFEAAADGANTIQITNAKWTTGRVDANNVAELTILSRNNP